MSMNDWNAIFRKAIAESDLTVYMVAKRANVPVSVLQRFMEPPLPAKAVSAKKGKRKTLTLDTASKLALVLGIELKLTAQVQNSHPSTSKRKPK